MTWRCWSVRNVLDLYVDGRLTDAAAGTVRGHLAACAACRAEAEPLESARALLRDLGPVAVPPGLVDSILKKLEEGDAPAEAGWQPGLGPAWLGAPAQWLGAPARAAALVYLALLAGAHALPGEPTQGTGPAREWEARI